MNGPAHDPSARPFRTFLGATATVIVIVLLVAGLRSYRDLSIQRARESALEDRISETDERIDQLRREIELLTSDPATIERAAREDLGMARPGDIVIRLTSDEPPVEAAVGLPVEAAVESPVELGTDPALESFVERAERGDDLDARESTDANPASSDS